MTVTTFLLIALSSFAFIAIRAFQQLNVMHHNVWMVMPTSGLMAITEVTVLINAVAQGWWSWIPMWVGGGTGCIFAMFLHKWIRSKNGSST